MGSIISAEQLLTAPPDWLNQPCRQDARREKSTTYDPEMANHMWVEINLKQYSF